MVLGSFQGGDVNKINDIAQCPQCRTPMGVEEPALCTHCGWVSVAEIKRQISYWNQRLLAATKVQERA